MNSFFKIRRKVKNQNWNIEKQVVSAGWNQALEKEFNLEGNQHSDHEYLKIEGTFYYLSNLWEGQTAYIKVDSEIVWMDSHNWNSKYQSSINRIFTTGRKRRKYGL